MSRSILPALALLASLAGLSHLAADPADPTATAVPIGPAVTVDGKLGADEWAAARHVGRPGQRSIRWMRDAENLSIACEGQGIATVFVLRGDEIHVLHASARLGRAVYTRQGETWKRKQSFDYQPPSDDFWKREKWRASVAGTGKTAFEFTLSLEDFLGVELGKGGKKKSKREKPRAPSPIALPPIAVVLWSPAGNLQLPEKGCDGITSSQLLMGHTPESLPFDPARWERWELTEDRSGRSR